MLGGLARWLRICGYDAVYVRKASDEELIERASKEGFVLLTRDRLLYRKAIRAGLVAQLVEGGGEARSLAAISRRCNRDLDPECSRCPNCGASLRSEDKTALYYRIPLRTYEAYDDFWVCDSCGKVFWRGSHWRNIVEMVEEACRLVRSPL